MIRETIFKIFKNATRDFQNGNSERFIISYIGEFNEAKAFDDEKVKENQNITESELISEWVLSGRSVGVQNLSESHPKTFVISIDNLTDKVAFMIEKEGVDLEDIPNKYIRLFNLLSEDAK